MILLSAVEKNSREEAQEAQSGILSMERGLI